MSREARVVRAGAADLDRLADVVAEAFADLPPSRWLIDDPQARRAAFPAYFRLYLEHALAHGVVDTTPDRNAAALWLPVTGKAGPEPPGYQARLRSATWPWTARFQALDAAMDEHHPDRVPHRHLAILAVLPAGQGHGTGTVLLARRHAELDVRGEAAYLEASSERSRDLYLRHGYHVMGAPFHLPDGGPPMWPMWRDPR